LDDACWDEGNGVPGAHGGIHSRRRQVEEFARQQGLTTLEIHVLAGNQQAAAIYRRAGYRPDEMALLKQLE
jgi:GNAT superfamily N-acetyltransferase